jgi:thiol-disulfide isomerase/thioredoxin
VIITGDKKDFPLDMKITGSKIQDVRNIIARRTKNYDKQRDSLVSISVRLMQITGDSIETIQKTLWNKIYKIDSLTVVEKKKFIKEYSNSFAALQELFWQKNQFTRDSIYAIYRSLKPLYKESQYGQRIGNYLKVGDILKQGDSFSDFEALDQFGKTRKLSDFKGKYILLDFSTTYCGPCMAAADELKKLSEELKSNLTVISFSGDANKEIWMQGIRRDSPTWINLWDGKGFYGETIIKYGIQGYPTFYLISPQGKIVTNWTGYNKGLIGNMISKIINPS